MSEATSKFEDPKNQKNKELKVFLFLTVVMAPLLSIVVVGGYGFLVWMYQLLVGPPSI